LAGIEEVPPRPPKKRWKPGDLSKGMRPPKRPQKLVVRVVEE